MAGPCILVTNSVRSTLDLRSILVSLSESGSPICSLAVVVVNFRVSEFPFPWLVTHVCQTHLQGLIQVFMSEDDGD